MDRIEYMALLASSINEFESKLAELRASMSDASLNKAKVVLSELNQLTNQLVEIGNTLEDEDALAAGFDSTPTPMQMPGSTTRSDYEVEKSATQLVFGEYSFQPFRPDEPLEVCVTTFVMLYKAIGLSVNLHRGLLIEDELVAEWAEIPLDLKKSVVAGFGIIDQCYTKLESMVTSY